MTSVRNRSWSNLVTFRAKKAENLFYKHPTTLIKKTNLSFFIALVDFENFVGVALRRGGKLLYIAGFSLNQSHIEMLGENSGLPCFFSFGNI